MEPIGEVVAKTVTTWAWYQAALKNPDQIGKGALAVHENEPHQGYYRVLPKGGNWEPVAIFYPEGSDVLVGYRNGREVNDLNALWTWCCRNPVSYQAYNQAIDGNGWDDEPAKAPSIGHNSSEADPFEAIKIELSGEIELASELLSNPITSQAMADKIGIWTTKVRTLGKRADDQRKIEKQPHLDAGRAVDDKWRELIDLAGDITTKLKKHIEPFLKEQARIERERVRKAQEEAERIRRDAEAKARENALSEEAKAEAERKIKEAEDSAAARNASAGRTGARVSLRKKTVGVVEDYEKAAIALVRMNHKDLKDMIDTLADRAARAGMPFDGMKIDQVETV